MKERLRALGRRWHWFDRALDVQDRYGEVNGSFVAAAITVTVFLSLFPLVLVAIAVVGFLASDDAGLADRVVENLGLTGDAARTMEETIGRASESRRAASVVGLLGLAWSGSAVAVALQQGVRAPWQERSNGLRDRLLGMAWLLVAALGFVVALVLGGVLNFLPDEVPKPAVSVLAIAFGLLLEIGLFWWMFWGLGTRRVHPRALLPGAVLAGVGFEILKLVGTVLVPRLVAQSSALYGPIGVVFAVLTWLAVLAKLIVYASTLNVVRFEARRGTVEVPIRVPVVPGPEPVAATRGGVVLEVGGEQPAVPDPLPGSQAEALAEGEDEGPAAEARPGGPGAPEDPDAPDADGGAAGPDADRAEPASR